MNPAEPFVPNNKPIFACVGLPAQLSNGGIMSAARAILAPAAATIFVPTPATAGVAGPYNLSNTANRALNVFYSEDNGATYTKISLTGLVGAAPAATTAAELAALISTNPVFAAVLFATNNAGTLEILAKQKSSRFKFYFTGTLATVLGAAIAAANSTGTAVVGATQPGSPFELIVETQDGTPIVGASVHLTASLSASLGLVELGDLASGVLGDNDIVVNTDANGKIRLYIMDAIAEVASVTARVGSNTSALAVLSQYTANVTFS